MRLLSKQKNIPIILYLSGAYIPIPMKLHPIPIPTKIRYLETFLRFSKQTSREYTNINVHFPNSLSSFPQKTKQSLRNDLITQLCIERGVVRSCYK